MRAGRRNESEIAAGVLHARCLLASGMVGLASLAMLVGCGGGGGETDAGSSPGTGGGGGGGAGAAAAPVITQQPADKTTAPPEPATFSVAFTGSPTPTVQWQLSLNGGATWTSLGGATASSYSTAGGTLGQGARNNLRQYRAVLTNASGSVTSSAATWFVRPVALGGLPNGLNVSSSGELTVLSAPNYSETSVFPVSNPGAALIERVASNGTVSPLAGSGVQGLANGSGSAARFHLGNSADVPFGTARDAAGNTYLPDWQNNVVRRVASDGGVSTFAGSGLSGSDDGTLAAARFSRPRALAVASDGTVYVADSSRRIRKIAAGTVTTLPTPIDALALAIGPADTLHVLQNGSVLRITAAGAVSSVTLSVTEDNSALARLSGLTIDPTTGTMYATDSGMCLIRKITPDGTVTTLAGGNAPNLLESCGYTDGTGRAAKFSYKLFGITIDPAGNLYAADGDNLAIRRITPAGVVTTFAR